MQDLVSAIRKVADDSWWAVEPQYQQGWVLVHVLVVEELVDVVLAEEVLAEEVLVPWCPHYLQ